MANIIDNAKKMYELNHLVQEQRTVALDHFKVRPHVETSIGTIKVKTESDLRSTMNILFYIRTPQNEQLVCHYDIQLNELVIDSCSLSLTFKAMKLLLEEFEAFVRKILATVESPD